MMGMMMRVSLDDGCSISQPPSHFFSPTAKAKAKESAPVH